MEQLHGVKDGLMMPVDQNYRGLDLATWGLPAQTSIHPKTYCMQTGLPSSVTPHISSGTDSIGLTHADSLQWPPWSQAGHHRLSMHKHISPKLRARHYAYL